MPIEITRAAIGGLGPWELIIILAVILIVFGAGKLPKVGSSLGEAMKNFRKSVNDKNDNDTDEKPTGGGPKS